ncbi:MAG: tRNA pseudouridine(55) synthase TruB [Alphaproteobacteria bacterium]|nr:tRNA pseudouridine(55) synthase TruB [Alphaproteobacteria bacterium]MBV8548217.1 tRNA pseudouridine(55) synthase TruB [Alphaproteobacteria bacterium]
MSSPSSAPRATKPPVKNTVHGWLVLDKPLGLTSTQALGKVRRLLGGKKVGHGGTLDPLATGILPLAFGEATKLIPYVMDNDKGYEFTVRWGEARTTDDSEGTVTAASDARPTRDAILAALPAFTGVIQQTPPIYSAIKLEGERAYDLARAGEQVELASRQVDIYELTFIDQPDADHARFYVSCGKGMYVRSLARDLALKLGTYGYVSALRRTHVGPFSLENAISLENLEALGHKNAALTALLDLQAALDDIPGLTLTASEAQRLRSGQEVMIRPQHDDALGGHAAEAGLVFASCQGVPVALIEPVAGAFRVVRGFHF